MTTETRKLVKARVMSEIKANQLNAASEDMTVDQW